MIRRERRNCGEAMGNEERGKREDLKREQREDRKQKRHKIEMTI